MPDCDRTAELLNETWRRHPDGDRAPLPEILSLKNVADMFGVSRLLLWYCEFRGLISRRRDFAGQRVYRWADCERIALIIKCRNAGVPLRDVVSIIKSAEEDASVELAKASQEKCMTLVDRLEQRRRMLDEALAELTHLYEQLSARILTDESRDKIPNQPV